MWYIVHCTLQTLVGIGVIVVWLAIGFLITKIWWKLGNFEQLGKNRRYWFLAGTAGGPITAVFLLAHVMLSVFPAGHI